MQILLKRSYTAGNVPEDLVSGELAINLHDGVLFYKDVNNTIQSISGTPKLRTINSIDLVGAGNIMLPTMDDLGQKAELNHKHSTADIDETPMKSFISLSEKSNIATHQNVLQEHSNRLSILESSAVTPTDEKVKMESSGTASYLSDLIDGMTIQSVGGKLAVMGVDGLDATMDELNQLRGVRGNVQSQIDALTTIGNFKGVVQTYAELIAITDMVAGDLIIVVKDEDHDNVSTIYIFSDNEWVYTGEFKGGEIRDFTTEPLNLAREVTGILPATNMEIPAAGLIPIENSSRIFTSTNVEGALNELFTYANSIKGTVANAIGAPVLKTDSAVQIGSKIIVLKTDLANRLLNKGVYAHSSESIQNLADKIALIPTTQITGIVRKRNIGSANTGHVENIQLSNEIDISDIVVTVLVHNPGPSGQAIYSVGFSPDEAIQFEENDRLLFENKVKVNTEYITPVTEVPYSDLGKVFKTTFSQHDYTINKIILE